MTFGSKGPSCPQICVLPPGVCPETVQSEDCLNLDIYVPLNQSSSPLPVLVFIPGGAFIQGTASSSLYDPTVLVNTTNVIVVVLNYRIGVLGDCFWNLTSSKSADRLPHQR